MKNLILILALTVGLIGCGEDGGSSGDASAAASVELNKVYFTFHVTEPTDVEIEVQPWIDEVGWDMDHVETYTGTVSPEDNQVQYHLTSNCRIYVKKAETNSTSSFNATVNGGTVASVNMGSEYYIHEMSIMDLSF